MGAFVTSGTCDPPLDSLARNQHFRHGQCPPDTTTAPPLPPSFLAVFDSVM
jgi:hypothetical protein